MSPLFRGGQDEVVFRFGERMSKLLEQDTRRFSFFTQCEITHLRPARGVLDDKFGVTIVGASFTGVPQFRFGDLLATSVQIVSTSEALVTAPPLHPGKFAITCSLNAVDFSNAVVYFTSAPSAKIISIYPLHGSEVGGYTVNVIGEGFDRDGDFECIFGNATSQAYFVRPGLIRCLSPSGIVGNVTFCI